MTKRNTVQKGIVRRALVDLDHPTVDQLYEYIYKIQPAISRATLYRNLKNLVEDGDIIKVDLLDGPSRYDNLTREHFHGSCRSCGKVIDIFMEEKYDELLKKGIGDSGGFHIEEQEVLFIGLCKSCKD